MKKVTYLILSALLITLLMSNHLNAQNNNRGLGTPTNCPGIYLEDDLCGSGILNWTAVEGALSYEITASYDGATQTSSIINSLINYSTINLALIPIPEDYDSSNPYTLSITPLDYLGAVNPNNTRLTVLDCTIELVLSNTCVTKNGVPNTTGGSKAFVPIEAGGGGKDTPQNGGKTYTNNQQLNTKVSLAPNPVQNQFTISTQSLQTTTTNISIYNTAGQRIDTIYDQQILEAGKQQLTYDTTHLMSGIYYLVLQTETETISQKLVKLP